MNIHTSGSGAIAAPHTLATKAGEEAYARGGNAIDAALAAATALTVVYPHNTALGGDLVALVRTPDGKISCINASGPSPLAQDLKLLRRRHGTKLPVRGADVITVPGAVRGWEALRGFGAKLDWSAQFDSAIRHAEEGVPVARSLAAAIVEDDAALRADPGCASLFKPGGKSLTTDDKLRQPALAESLRQLAADGSGAFYGGTLGSRLVAGLQALGCPITLGDLEVFQPEITDPLSTDYAGHTVFTSPPNTQGFALMRTLRALSEIEPANVSPSRLARLFFDGTFMRETFLSDPATASVDVLTEGFEELLTSLETTRTGEPVLQTTPFVPTGDTVGVAAADSDGFAVSIIQSVYHGFGAAVLEPDTGILMQNRGMSFSLDPDSPNVIAPGKRPAHTLMPVIICKDRDVRWVNSTMGGQGQPQIHAQLLLGLLNGATPQEAVETPRWILGPLNAQESKDTIYAEEDVAPPIIDALVSDRFPVKTVPSRTDWIGHANVVARNADGSFAAGSDPRADGAATIVAFRGNPAA